MSRSAEPTKASSTVPLLDSKRQRNVDDAAGEKKPLPNTVTGVPPSDAPRGGHTDETAGAGMYVNDAPLDENCCPFIDTSSRRAPAPDAGGAAHSSCRALTRRAAAVEPLASKRQRSVSASGNAAPPTDRATRGGFGDGCWTLGRQAAFHAARLAAVAFGRRGGGGGVCAAAAAASTNTLSMAQLSSWWRIDGMSMRAGCPRVAVAVFSDANIV